MFDTMTYVKTGAALCTALLIYLFAQWGSDSLYSTAAEAHGDAEDHGPAQGYVIAALDAGHGDDHAEEAEVSFADVYAAADAAKGEKVFGKCKACHKVEDGANGTGPHLFGLVNRPVGGVASFGGYSDTMASLGGDWTPELLDAFLTKPKDVVPGTKMTFSGLKKVEDRANLIKWLEGIGG